MKLQVDQMTMHPIFTIPGEKVNLNQNAHKPLFDVLSKLSFSKLTISPNINFYI
jgi:hypothetical protein